MDEISKVKDFTPRGPAGEGTGEEERNLLSPAAALTERSRAERETIASQSHPNAALIHETIRAEGEAELKRAASALLLSGFAAGLSIGVSVIVQGSLRARLPDAPWRPLVDSLGYTVGFLIVVLGRQQLFTENTLTPILPLLHNRDGATLARVARLWALVLVANIAGTLIMGATLAFATIFPPQTQAAFAELGRHAMDGSFDQTLLRAVFAGWLIALMVWILPAVGSARPFMIIVITYAISLGGFSHLIAGSVEAAYAAAAGEASWADYGLRFFLPTLIGNVLGGVALVAGLNWGQVAPQLASPDEGEDGAPRRLR